MMPGMGEFLAAIRVQNRASSNSGSLSAIFQNFRGILRNPSVAENGPFLVDNRE